MPHELTLTLQDSAPRRSAYEREAIREHIALLEALIMQTNSRMGWQEREGDFDGAQRTLHTVSAYRWIVNVIHDTLAREKV